MNTKILKKSPQILATLLMTLFVSTEASAAPNANPDRLNTTVGVAKTVGVLWNDRGNGLYVSKVNNYSSQGGRTYVIAGRQIHYTPKAGFRGTDTFWYEVRDAHGRTNSSMVTVNVGGGHHRGQTYYAPAPVHHYQPRRHKPSYHIQWAQPGFSISYSKPGGISARINTPQHHYAQPQRHHYVQPRSHGKKNWGRGGNAPTARPDSFTAYASSAQVPLRVLANDQGYGLKVHQTNRYTQSGGQAWVVNNHSGSYIMYKPKPGFIGVDTVWYVMRDANGRTNSTRATVHVR